MKTRSILSAFVLFVLLHSVGYSQSRNVIKLNPAKGFGEDFG